MIQNPQSGLIKMIILIVIGIIILGYFGINLRSIIESDTVQDNLNYVKNGIFFVWENYLKKPVFYVWNNIFIDLFWETFVEMLEKLKNDGTTPFEEVAPSIPN